MVRLFPSSASPLQSLFLLGRSYLFSYVNKLSFLIYVLCTVKSHFKALGLYNFKRGLGWAYKRVGL